MRDEVGSLKTALENRKVIEAAKGVIMQNLGVGEADAMKRLRKKARDTRRSMADLAKAILETSDLMGS